MAIWCTKYSLLAPRVTLVLLISEEISINPTCSYLLEDCPEMGKPLFKKNFSVGGWLSVQPLQLLEAAPWLSWLF